MSYAYASLGSSSVDFFLGGGILLGDKNSFLLRVGPDGLCCEVDGIGDADGVSCISDSVLLGTDSDSTKLSVSASESLKGSAT